MIRLCWTGHRNREVSRIEAHREEFQRSHFMKTGFLTTFCELKSINRSPPGFRNGLRDRHLRTPLEHASTFPHLGDRLPDPHAEASCFSIVSRSGTAAVSPMAARIAIDGRARTVRSNLLIVDGLMGNLIERILTLKQSREMRHELARPAEGAQLVRYQPYGRPGPSDVLGFVGCLHPSGCVLVEGSNIADEFLGPLLDRNQARIQTLQRAGELDHLDDRFSVNTHSKQGAFNDRTPYPNQRFAIPQRAP